jgi:hypothetical protein
MVVERGFRRVKAGFTFGRSGFFIEADDGQGADPDIEARARVAKPWLPSLPAKTRAGSRRRAARAMRR